MAAARPSAPAFLAGRHVLIVEDDQETRHMLALVLKNAGAAVSEASSGAAAELELRERAFDLLVADWNLPDMPGHELLDRIERKHPGVSRRCVIITGDLIRRGDPHEAERRGLPLLRKPFRPGELVEAVRRAIGV